MKKKRFSPRDVILVFVLIVMVIGLTYYMGYYTPLQAELESLNEQIATTEAQISTSSARITTMNTMQAELDQILAMPEDQITEIAPYDNKEVVLALLNGILAETQYSLSFSDPSLQEDGTVRRNVSMNFSCESYDDAKEILDNLDKCRWRCLISNLSIGGSGDVMEGPVSVSATITFFESTNVPPLGQEVLDELFEDEDYLDEDFEDDVDDEELRDALADLLAISDNGESVLQSNGTTDRGTVLTILWRLEGKPEPEGTIEFVDVDPDAWYADAIYWAAENSIIIGFGNEFFPLNAITNEELSSIMFRYSAYKGIDPETLKDNPYAFISGESEETEEQPAEEAPAEG